MKACKFTILYLSFFFVYLSITLALIFDPPRGGRKFPGSHESQVEIEHFPSDRVVKIEVVEIESEGEPSTRTHIKEHLKEAGSKGHIGGFTEDVHKIGELEHHGMFDIFSFFGNQYNHLKHFLFGAERVAKERAQDVYEYTKEKGKETLKESLYQGKEKIEETYDTAKEKVGEAAETVKETAESVAGKLKGGYQELKEKTSETVENAKEAASETLKNVKRRGEETMQSAKETAENVKEKVQDTAGTMRGKAKETVESVKETAETVKEKASEKIEQGKEKAKEAGNFVLEKVENVYEEAKEKVEEVFESAKGTAGSVKERFQDTFEGGRKLGRKLYLTIRNVLWGSKEKAKKKMASITHEMTPFEEVETYWKEFITSIPELSEGVKKKLRDEGVKAIQTLELKKSSMDISSFDEAKAKLDEEMHHLEKTFGHQIEAVLRRFEDLWKKIEIAHKTGKIDFNLPHHTVMKCGSCGKEYSFVDFLDMFEDFDHEMSFPDTLPSNQKELEEFYEGWATWANYLKLKCPSCSSSNWHELVIIEPKK